MHLAGSVKGALRLQTPPGGSNRRFPAGHKEFCEAGERMGTLLGRPEHHGLGRDLGAEFLQNRREETLFLYVTPGSSGGKK